MREGLTDKKKCQWNYNSKSLWVSSHWAHQRGPSDWYGIWKSQAICNSEVRDNGRTANKRVGWMWMFMHWAVGCVCQSLSHSAVRPSEKLQKCHAFIRQDRRLSLNGWLRGTRAGSLALLWGIFPTQGSIPGLWHCRQILYQLSHPGSPRILEWVAYPFSSTSPRPRN